MAWDFETEPEFEEKLEWMRGFLADEIMPLEGLPAEIQNDRARMDELTAPLKEQVKEKELWAAHLPPELGDEETPLFAGGLLTFFAVGCPVCNRFVVSLIGTSGALNWFRPIQPVLGAAALGLLWVALRRRLGDLSRTSCELPG